jgi:hypothetical protein
MKIFTILCSFFIFYLVTIPCVDEIIHIEKSMLENTTPQGHSCNHEDQDSCSPFCVCSCCGIVVVLTNIIFDSQPVFIQETEFLSIYTETSSNFFQSFWQPPK